MAARATRRSVSVTLAVYAKAMAYAVETGVPLASIVENHLRSLCGMPRHMSYWNTPGSSAKPTGRPPSDVDRPGDTRETLDALAELRRLRKQREQRAAADRIREYLDTEGAIDNPCTDEKCKIEELQIGRAHV